MKTHALNLILALVAIAGVGAAIYEYQSAHQAAVALAEAQSASAQLRQQVARSDAHPARMPATSPVAAGLPVKAPAATGDGSSPLAGFLKMLANPRFQRMTELQAKIRLDAQYGGLFKALNLSPDQLAQFKSLLVEKQMVAFDSMSAAQEQGIDLKSDPKGFFMAVADGQKAVETQISDLLGTDNYSQFQQYQGTIPARNTANLLQQSLSYTSTPLTPEQSSGLVQILTQYGSPPLPPGNPFAVLNSDLGVIKLSDQAVAQAQGLLSQAQLQALQADVRQQQQLFQARRQAGP
jgi:hypothetical protein